jgi:Zn-dependent protease with chaperone function
VIGAAVGFAVVFGLVAAAVSAVAWAVVAALGPALARRGPAAERRALELAALAPLVLATAAVGALIARSLVGVDHCADHDHHAHLCVHHGAAWLARPWAIALAGAGLALVLARVAALAARLGRGAVRVRALARLAETVDGVRVVDSPRAFCFVAGLRRPAIYASRTVWERVPADERAAMLAHERAHVRGGDLTRRVLVELAAAVGAPGVPAFLLARWDDASERLRDRDAAHATDADSVARALVTMCRLGAMRVAGLGFEPVGRRLVRRVEAVLGTLPAGEPWARALARVGALAALVAVGVLALASDPLHHLLETLLG